MLEEEFIAITKNRAQIRMIDFASFLVEYGRNYNIQEKTIDKLIAKLKYRDNVYSTVKENSESIIQDAVKSYYNNVTTIQRLFTRKSYLGGIFSDVDNFQIEVNKVNNVNFVDDSENEYIRISAKAKVSYGAELTEYFNKDTYKKEHISDTIDVLVKVEMVIDYSKGYEAINYETTNVIVQEISNIKGKSINALKKMIVQRDGYRCAICGKRLNQDEVSLDHIIPRSYGGTDDPSNLQVTCIYCNTTKSNKLYPYTICPDCGTKIFYWNDGGNGFCKDCASYH